MVEDDVGAFLKKYFLAIGGLISLILIGLYFALFGQYSIPSANMDPTLKVGDRILVREQVDPSAIKAGDVVVVRLPYRGGQSFVSRVIGLPGDKLQMKFGKLQLNGEQVQRTFVRDVSYTDYTGVSRKVKEYEEHLPSGATHKIYERTDNGPLDRTGLFIVPEGHIFLMGDNRDGSADSRYLNDMGYVKLDYLVGKVLSTTYSLYDCQNGDPTECETNSSADRFFKQVE